MDKTVNPGQNGLLGYRLLETLYSGSRTVVYRAIEETTQHSVVIKLLRAEYPTFNDLLRFRNQYTIAHTLKIPGVVHAQQLIPHRHSYALVMEDVGGISLRTYILAHPLMLAEVLAIALQLATILHDLYQHRVMHKDIKPANILIHPQSHQVSLIDFSIASLLPKETEDVKHPSILEGTLAYIAPEQTGRMNRGVDYRTDFYALGVTLFELLTGQLPFQAEDPLELVHCHIAQPVPSVCDYRPELPTVIGQIVAKLMAKNAEDRYQTALGLKFDLEVALQQLSTSGTIESFELATRDVCDRFLIPEKLYGREKEVQILLEAFNRVAVGASELILVSGFSGIGKTAVVNEVHKPIVKQRGYFIKGKFDQLNRNIPFSAFVQAFRDLIRQLFSESDIQLQIWQTQILDALGDNSQLMIEVIPELEQILGSQPPAPELSGLAAQNRFNLLFQKFIHVFATAEHPLVIFLDDLQWADAASLKLIQLLVEAANSSYLLLIGAYRDNEVLPTHPLMITLNEIRKPGAVVTTFTLPPLSPSHLNQLVADTLACSPNLAQPLTHLVSQKTQGNPFFVTQFLKALHQAGWITFNQQAGYWQGDLSQIRAAALTDDVVEFMALQLQKLPGATQRILQLAACIGNHFDLATLIVASETSVENTVVDLWCALKEGFILPTSEIYKFFQETSDSRRQPLEQTGTHTDRRWHPEPDACSYRFLHDRVQQAAYSLIPEAQKSATHLKIGQLLLRCSSITDRDEKIFELVNQLNYGSELLATQTERNELAHLNQIAGSKAKTATAYTAALGYFTTGLQLIDRDSWQHDYGLTLKLYESAAEAAYLSGDLEQVEPLIQIVLQQAHTAADKALVYQVQILTASAQAELFRGVQIGIQALADLGIHLPETVQPQVVEQALETIASQLAQRSLPELLALSRMTDRSMLAAMRLLSDLNNLAFQSTPQLLPLIMLKQVELSLHYGNSPDSALAYAGYGFMLLNVVGNIDTGYEFGQLALNLVDRLDANAIRGKIGFLTTVWFNHWKHHVNTGLQPALEYYQAALLSGDLEFAALSLFLHSYMSYHLGRELTALQREMTLHHQTILSLKQEGSLRLHMFHEQLVANLQGPSLNLQILQGDYYDEQQQLAIHLNRNERSLLCHLYVNKLMLCYWFGDYALAASNAIKTAEYLDGLPSNLVIALFAWYDALTCLALYPHASSLEQPKLLAQVMAHQQKMQIWASHAPMNFLHKWQLVEAERYRVVGKYVEAMDAYDRAITLAKDQDYTHEFALANELAARFYLDWGKETIAQMYLTKAYYGYAHWGAKAKIKDLEQRYPPLLAPIVAQTKLSIATKHTLVSSETSSHFSTTLDLNTILQASQALSQEIQLKQLLPTLIQMVVTNAGADKAALFLNSGGSLELGIKYFDNAVQSLQPKPVDECNYVPLALIHYVEHTLETVITDCQTHVSVVKDPYCLLTQPKSLLCTPILHQGQLVAVLYLENAITSNAFTEERVELLKLLCTQAAISLENARLYQQSQAYAQELERSLAALQASQARFQKVADNIPGAIYQLQINPQDGSSITSYISSGCLNLYEVSAEEILSGSYNLRNFEHPDDQAGINQARQQAEQHLTPFQHEWRIITPTGQVKWVQSAAQPERQANDWVVWDGVLIDISDRKAAEAERDRLLEELSPLNRNLALANQQLEEYSQTLEQRVEERTAELKMAQERIIAQEKLASLGTLTAGVAHELRNPLNFVKNYAEGSIELTQDLLDSLNPLLKTQPPDTLSLIQSLLDDLQYNAATIRRHSQRAEQIIATMMEHARTHNETADPQPTPLHEFLNEAVKLAYHSKRIQDSDFNLTIETVYDPRLTLVNLVPGTFIRAIINLIDNACDAMRQKQHRLECEASEALADYTPTLQIATRLLENQVEIRIRDNGCGIDPQIQAQVLDPFFTTKAPGEGTGLGLSLTHDIIVQQHQGTLTIHSEPGEFTQVIITLPVR